MVTAYHGVIVRDDADQGELDEAIWLLRAKAACACIPSTKREIWADVDVLLDRRIALSAVS